MNTTSRAVFQSGHLQTMKLELLKDIILKVKKTSVRRLTLFGASVLGAVFIGALAEAKDLNSRLGVGYRNAFPFDMPAVSALYYPSADWGLVGALGVDTEYQNSKFGVQVGLRKVVFKETQMNFFMGSSLAMVSREVNAQTDSGFVLDALVGSEFFLQGLDSLGFSLESGISVSNISRVRFRTLADHLLRAGIVFYF